MPGPDRLALAACVALIAFPALADDVTVFAAASLTDALDRIAAQWSAETGQTAVMSYAGSSALAAHWSNPSVVMPGDPSTRSPIASAESSGGSSSRDCSR